MWLIGWMMIAVHFAALVFLNLQGFPGVLAAIVSLVALVSAGELFKTSVIPFRIESSSQWMTGVLLAVNALYMTLIEIDIGPAWILNVAATLFTIGPLAITLASLRKVNFALRWTTVMQNIALTIFLLVVQHKPEVGHFLAINAVLFAMYLGCSINFLFAYRRATAGTFITIVGFMAWASVFAVGPWLYLTFPQIQVDAEVWNLPKFLVALGMTWTDARRDLARCTRP